MLGGCLLPCEIRARYELMGEIDKVISVLTKMECMVCALHEGHSIQGSTVKPIYRDVNEG